MFAHAREADTWANKKISSRTVGTGVAVLIIRVVQQLRVDELCIGKKLPDIVDMKQIVLLLFNSLQGAIKHIYTPGTKYIGGI